MTNLRAALTDIYTTYGELTPQLVVDEARPKGAPLHDRFEWDDKVAGEAYRRVQAGQLIRSVQIEYVPGERKYVRAFASVRQTADPEKRGYQPTEEILEDPLASEILLRECERAITDLKLKYGHLAEFRELLRRAAA
jgi:hypothetical protein